MKTRRNLRRAMHKVHCAGHDCNLIGIGTPGQLAKEGWTVAVFANGQEAVCCPQHTREVAQLIADLTPGVAGEQGATYTGDGESPDAA